VDTDDATVTVNNVPPTAEAGPDRAVAAGQPVTFDGVAIDPGADTFTYEWDFDYDGAVFDVDATGQTVSTSYGTGPATYVVALRVTDDDGGVGIDTAAVSVGNAPPVAEAGGPYSGNEGSPIVLTGSGADPTNDPLTYVWDLDGDGAFETPGQVVTYIWPDDGQFTVRLRVDDGRGGVDIDDAIVKVSNVAPVADAGGPYMASVAVTQTLVATASDVPSDTLGYAWDLDDDGSYNDGSGRTVSYVWTTTGTFTVTLRVDDGDGGVTFDSARVHVNSLYPFAWLGIPYLLALSKRVVGSGRRPRGRRDEQANRSSCGNRNQKV
jgi:hypothetical protein